MAKDIIYSAKMLEQQIYEIRQKAMDSIMAIMKKLNVTKIDFTIDPEGHEQDHDDYDFDWLEDNKMFVDCYGDRFGNEDGYVTEVEIVKPQGDPETLSVTAEGENDTYTMHNVDRSVNVWVMILERLQAMYPDIQ